MKIIICDDQAIIREGLTMLISLEKDIEILGTASDGAEALELVEKVQPDLVLMDLKMPIMNGIEATRQIRTKFPNVKVLVLTTYSEDEWVFDAIRAGASGYLLKDTPRETVMDAIKGTFEGKTYVDPDVAGKLLNQVSSQQTQSATLLTSKLSEREIEVLRLLAKGSNNANIASKLFLSEGTIRNYISSIFEKLDVTDRTQAALIAVKHGFGDE
jgi:DNA-binding NarL/FixJ family response regulator